MALNVAGMLAQSGQNIGQSIGAPIQKFGEGLGSMLGARQQKQREQEEQNEVKQLLQKYANNPEQLNALGTNAAAEGNDQLSKVFFKAAEGATAKVAGEALVARKQAVATRAEALGLPNVAESARSASDNDALDSIAKDLRSMEIKRLPSQTPGQRAQRARLAGITQAEFKEAGLATATDDYFESYVTGNEGKTEAWADSQGNISAYRFNKAGKVYNEATQQFVEPSELDLVQKAPQVQKVIDASDKMIESLADESVKDIVNLRDKARTAKGKLDIINRQIERLDGGMPTGIAANIQVGLQRVGQLMGMPYNPQLTNAQEYMMEVANLVKQEIKAFGSGTSITDADREYTQNMVGGNITQQAEALEAMLKIYKEAAEGTINQYNDIVSDVSSDVGSDNMGTFRPITLPEDISSTQLSPAALRYISGTEEG
jgi:hypothetical protein